MAETPSGQTPTVLLVGGYGLVGGELARLLRRRHPGLHLLLAGRSPERGAALAAELGAGTGLARVVRVDVEADDPLAVLDESDAGRVDLVVTVVNDPRDRVLVAAVRRGLPLVDITRWTARMHRAVVRLAGEDLRAPVVLASGWMAGLASIAASAAVRRLPRVERIFVDILYAMADRSGPDSIEYMDRLALPFETLREGRDRAAWPLTEARRARFAGGVQAETWRLDTPEQSSLPAATGAHTVEARIAFDSAPATSALVWMQKLGILALLQRPRFTRLRRALLAASGDGGTARFTVEADGGGAKVRCEVSDKDGQAHLTAVGALIAVERALALDGAGPLAPRVHFPERFPSPDALLETARSLGVEVALA